MGYNIAMTTGHNATVAVSKDGKLVCAVELERVHPNDKRKNVGFSDVPGTKQGMIDMLKRELPDVDYYDNMLLQHSDVKAKVIQYKAHLRFGKIKQIQSNREHHVAHASGSFYQSPFERAIAISIDGGGNDGVFNLFKMVRGKDPQLITKFPINLGFRYASFGRCCKVMQASMSHFIPSELDWNGNLIFPGKLMGLAGYGNVRQKWLPHFVNYFKTMTSKRRGTGSQQLLKTTDVDVTGNVLYDGQKERDIAATAQQAFEDVLLEMITPTIKRYNDGWPIVLTGGCALNIIANSKIEQMFDREVFVAPNSSDCGLAIGMLADLERPQQPWDVTYAGVDILDRNTFDFSKHDWQRTDINRVADLIIQGRIFGVMQGTSEHGPRALGNRSIICNPALPDMKDIINAKVKNREWYRPFAPVVRLEDVGKFFERDKESRWMNFNSNVKREYQSVLPSITHIDGTARVQTVTREQNALIYDILTAMDQYTGIGVLLNTSLNVDGQPIASKIEHAMTVYNTTEMDGVIINDRMIIKSS
tara:strand:+ start:1341 stop:2936 length:1596 start_codon:yes stop_codon:yes gene_type:complete